MNVSTVTRTLTLAVMAAADIKPTLTHSHLLEQRQAK
jgi:hypothetical protein